MSFQILITPIPKHDWKHVPMIYGLLLDPEPGLYPRRIKVGYSNDLDKRISRQHRHLTPNLIVLLAWPCHQNYESIWKNIMKENCQLLHGTREVFRLAEDDVEQQWFRCLSLLMPHLLKSNAGIIPELKAIHTVRRRPLLSASSSAESPDEDLTTWGMDILSEMKKQGGKFFLKHAYQSIEAARKASGRSWPKNAKICIQVTLQQYDATSSARQKRSYLQSFPDLFRPIYENEIRQRGGWQLKELSIQHGSKKI